MARKTQISKELILQAALEMLIERGYSSVNIKTLSQKIGCSTQPLVWQFESMEGLRKELADHALRYANQKMCPAAAGGIAAFRQVGTAYVQIALREPNLFRFVFLNGSGCYPMGGVKMLTEEQDNAQLIAAIAAELGIPMEQAGQYFQDTLIYTHGLASFAATGVMRLSETEMLALINRAGDYFLAQAGVPSEKIPPCQEWYEP